MKKHTTFTITNLPPGYSGYLSINNEVLKYKVKRKWVTERKSIYEFLRGLLKLDFKLFKKYLVPTTELKVSPTK